jgi:ferric-dicitrate binding protein FerR (iron transport regulator)
VGEVVELRNRSQRVEEACHWLTRVDRGLSQSESRALTRWLAFDRRNEAALRHACGIWDRLDGLARLGSAFPQAVDPARQGGQTRSGADQTSLRQRLSSAASIALVVLACVAGAWVASREAPARAAPDAQEDYSKSSRD